MREASLRGQKNAIVVRASLEAGGDSLALQGNSGQISATRTASDYPAFMVHHYFNTSFLSKDSKIVWKR
jgi:hypothetical protein